MVYDINRFLGSASHQTSLKKLYGSTIWEDNANSKDRVRCLVTLYRDLIMSANKAQTFSRASAKVQANQGELYKAEYC